MEKQTVICETPLSLQGIKKWYGEQAADNILTIADILRPYFETNGIGIGYTLQQYVVTEENGYVGRKMSNLIRGCPSFYPLRNEIIPVNEGDGFRAVQYSAYLIDEAWDVAESYSDWRDYPTMADGPLHVDHQDIITSVRLQDGLYTKWFGEGALELTRELNEMLKDGPKEPLGELPSHMLQYQTYVAEQYGASGQMLYVGFISSNLIRGCPILYPLYRSEFPANFTGGYKDIELPQNILDEIWSLNMSECALDPVYFEV